MKNILSSILVLLLSFITVYAAQSEPPHKPKQKPSGQNSDIPPCSDEVVLNFLSNFLLPNKNDGKKGDDSIGVSEVRGMTLDHFCFSCASVPPYDTVVRKGLLQVLNEDKYPDVRAEAAKLLPLLNNSPKGKEYFRDPEIINTLITSMRNDCNIGVRFEAAHALISYYPSDTLEVLDTLISIATTIPDPSSPDNEKPCPQCPSRSSKLRKGAIMGMRDMAVYNEEKVINTLKALIGDKDEIVSKTADEGVKNIQKRQQKGGQ